MSIVLRPELLLPLFHFLIGRKVISPLTLILVCRTWRDYILRNFCHPARGLGKGLLHACRHGYLAYFRLWFDPRWLKKFIPLQHRGKYGILLNHNYVANQALMEAVNGRQCGIIQELYKVGLKIFDAYKCEVFLEIASARGDSDFALFVIETCPTVYIPEMDPTPAIKKLYDLYGLKQRKIN
jgi:hypothetical protein